MERILLIDDSEVDRRICADSLTHAGFSVETAADGPAGLRALYAQRPDLVLLDVLMPAMDGWTVCERIRELSGVAIIMLTSLNREEEMIRGLDLGADDFVSKPISPRHLVARVRAVLRRRAGPEEAPPPLLYEDGALSMDVATHRVALRGSPVELTPIEFRLLAALAAAPGHVRSYAELLGTVWGPEYIDDIDFLRVYIWRLRRKIEDQPRSPRRILTERGFGYRLVPGDAAGPAETPQQERSGDGSASASAGPTVLLVEDDALSRKLMRDVLQANAYATVEVTSGDAALAAIAEARPGLIIMDVGLPGLDGVETTRRLKENPATSAIPIVAVTAYALPADEHRMRDAGCDAFLTKPLRLAGLVEVVRQHLPPLER